MKTFISIMVIFCVSISIGAKSSPAKTVKTVSYWTSPVMTLDDAQKLSRFSMVIADLDNANNNLESLKELKRLNPGLLLICYSNPMEIFDPLVSPRPLQNTWSKEIIDHYPEWLLKTRKGKKAVFYEGMRMLNMSSTCPRKNGKIYAEYMATLLIEKVFLPGKGLWDGYFMDNCSPTIAWVSPNDPLDITGDIDDVWSAGNLVFLNIIKEAMGKNFILIGNKGITDYSDILQGRMFEWFPNDYVGSKFNGGWWSSMANAAENGPYTIFLLKPKDLEFGILSAQMLGKDIYIGVGNNSLRWYEQYDQQLDPPSDEIKVIRKFGNRTIEITPSQRKGKFN